MSDIMEQLGRYVQPTRRQYRPVQIIQRRRPNQARMRAKRAICNIVFILTSPNLDQGVQLYMPFSHE